MNRLDSTKETAFKKRLEDKGWGRAAAHVIPLYGIHYAITRRTNTPLIWSYGGTFVIRFITGLIINPDGTANNEAVESIGFLIGVTFGPAFAKLGIDQSREYAKSRLKKLTKKESKNKQETSDNMTRSKQKYISNLSSQEPQAGKRIALQSSAPKPQWARGIDFKLTNPIQHKEMSSDGNTNKEVNDVKTPEMIENALLRYADLFKKGLIEKDEYDALRKRELGL